MRIKGKEGVLVRHCRLAHYMRQWLIVFASGTGRHFWQARNVDKKNGNPTHIDHGKPLDRVSYKASEGIVVGRKRATHTTCDVGAVLLELAHILRLTSSHRNV